MRKIVISLFLLATISVQSQTTEHVVKRGETYASIANKYGITEEALLKANPKAKKGMPFASQKLIIPQIEKVEKTGNTAKVVTPVVETPSTNDESKTSALVAEAKKEKSNKVGATKDDAEAKQEKDAKAKLNEETKQKEKEAKQQEKDAKAKLKEEAKLKEKEAKQKEKEAKQKEKEKEEKRKKTPRPEYSPYYEVAPDDPEIAFIKHIVQPDETVFKIWHKYGLKYKYKLFCRYNKSRYLEPGQLLLVPCDLATAQTYKENSDKAMRIFNSYTDAEKERYTKSGDWVGAMAKVATTVVEGVAEVKTGISNIKETWNGSGNNDGSDYDYSSSSGSFSGSFAPYLGVNGTVKLITAEEVASLSEEQRKELEYQLQEAMKNRMHRVLDQDDEIRKQRSAQRRANSSAAIAKHTRSSKAHLSGQSVRTANAKLQEGQAAQSGAMRTKRQQQNEIAIHDALQKNLFMVQGRQWSNSHSLATQHAKSAKRIANAQQEIKHDTEMHDSLERQYNQQASIVDRMDKGLLDYDEQSYREAKEKMRELREQNNSTYDQKIEQSNLEK